MFFVSAVFVGLLIAGWIKHELGIRAILAWILIVSLGIAAIVLFFPAPIGIIQAFIGIVSIVLVLVVFKGDLRLRG